MNQFESLTEEDLHLLNIYKNMQESKPITGMTIEDIPKIPALVEELKQAEEQEKPVIEEIETVESVIREKYLELEELKSRLNTKLAYIRQSQNNVPVSPRITNHIVKDEYAGITTESVLKVLTEELVYGGGNSQIAEKLNIPNSKGVQNKIYAICKKLLSDGKIKTENRLWKVL